MQSKVTDLLNSIPFWAGVLIVFAIVTPLLNIYSNNKIVTNNKEAFNNHKAIQCKRADSWLYITSKNGWELTGENVHKGDVLIPLKNCNVIKEEGV